MAGIVHALTLAASVVSTAPLAQHVPPGSGGGYPVAHGVTLGQWHEFARLRQFGPPYRLMLLSTFAVTVLFDLTMAVEVGVAPAVVPFVPRQSRLFEVHVRRADDQCIPASGYGPA